MFYFVDDDQSGDSKNNVEPMEFDNDESPPDSGPGDFWKFHIFHSAVNTTYSIGVLASERVTSKRC